VGVVQQNNDKDVDCLHDYCRIIKEERGIEPKVRACVRVCVRACVLRLVDATNRLGSPIVVRLV
jgi:hypothetical protein